MNRHRPPAWLRWSVGLLWLGACVAVLWAAHRPWEDLGGLVGERLRWLERFVLASGWIVGSALGRLAREGRPEARRARLRVLLYPAGVAAAAAMTGLRLAGLDDPVGVVLVAWVSYGAGTITAWCGIADWCRGAHDGDRPPG